MWASAGTLGGAAHGTDSEDSMTYISMFPDTPPAVPPGERAELSLASLLCVTALGGLPDWPAVVARVLAGRLAADGPPVEAARWEDIADRMEGAAATRRQELHTAAVQLLAVAVVAGATSRTPLIGEAAVELLRVARRVVAAEVARSPSTQTVKLARLRDLDAAIVTLARVACEHAGSTA